MLNFSGVNVEAVNVLDECIEVKELGGESYYIYYEFDYNHSKDLNEIEIYECFIQLSASAEQVRIPQWILNNAEKIMEIYEASLV